MHTVYVCVLYLVEQKYDGGACIYMCVFLTDFPYWWGYTYMYIFLTDFSSSGRVCLHCKKKFLSGGSGSPCYFATLCDLFLCCFSQMGACILGSFEEVSCSHTVLFQISYASYDGGWPKPVKKAFCVPKKCE